MSDGFYNDYTGAIFGGIADTFKKTVLLFSVPIFGHFVGVNCYEAPGLLTNLWAGGIAGLSSFSFWSSGVDLAMVPFTWVGTVMLSLTHIETFLYPLVLLYAWLKIWVAEDWWRGFSIILVAQPLDSWYLSCVLDNGMSRGAFAASGVFIGTYEIAVIAALVWFARQREPIE